MGNVREWLNKNSAMVTIAAVVLLVVALSILVMSFRRVDASDAGAYYFDLNTGRLFTASMTEIPPIEAPSGPLQTPQGPLPAGVRVHILSCGSCADFAGMTAEEVKAAGAEIAYLEMLTPEGKAIVTGPPPGPQEIVPPPEQYTLVADPATKQWQLSASPEGNFIVRSASLRECPGAAPLTWCTP